MRIDDREPEALLLLRLILAVIVIVVLLGVLCFYARADTIPQIVDDRSAVLVLHACDIHGCGNIMPPQDDVSMPQCMSTSLSVTAAWAVAHPEWTVRAFWCNGATP